MKKICITGGIACGKSLVGDMLRKLGVPVIDADEVCHELLGQKKIIGRIVAVFGRHVLSGKGGVDRKALGRIVFADDKKRRKLNALIHPEACQVIKTWLKAQNAGSPALAAAIIPLVYEVGWECDWDKIVCIAAPCTIRISRLRKKGLTEEEAKARISAQMPLDEKMIKADYVIFNSGTLAPLRRQTRLIFRNINEQTERCYGRKK